MFDIPVDLHKSAKFDTCKNLLTSSEKFNTSKMHRIPKLQKMVLQIIVTSRYYTQHKHIHHLPFGLAVSPTH